jgi:RHS repeat-associated protein
LGEYYYAHGRKLVKHDPDKGLLWYYTDHLGSTRLLELGTQQSDMRRDYYPFGESVTSSGDEESLYQFTGKEKDSNTGLFYFGARYYDPGIGRFLSVDPLAEKSLAWSPYVYTKNNPLRFIDPDGNEDLEALRLSTNYLEKPYGAGISDLSGIPDPNEINSLVCNEFVFASYRAAGHEDFPYAISDQADWFHKNNWLSVDENSGEKGDVIFFGDISKSGRRHVVLIDDYKDVEINGKVIRKYKVRGAGGGGSKKYAYYKSIKEYNSGSWWPDKPFWGIGSVQNKDNSSNQLLSSEITSSQDDENEKSDTFYNFDDSIQ